jgi:hypothetical protein
MPISTMKQMQQRPVPTPNSKLVTKRNEVCEDKFTSLIYKEKYMERKRLEYIAEKVSEERPDKENGLLKEPEDVKETEGTEVAKKKEETMDRPMDEDAYLTLDLSVLAERNSSENKIALSDRYGIRIFAPETEERIREYQAEEKQKENYYLENVFLSSGNMGEQELETIRSSVFSVTVLPGKEAAPARKSGLSWQNVAAVFAACFLVLVVGTFYGRYKKKGREKKLADIDNRYDE